MKGQFRLALLLLMQLACVTAFALDSTNATIDAIYSGNVKEVERLLASGVAVNATGNNGSALLMHAAYAGSKEITGLLIARGADVKIKNNAGQTSLHAASIGGKTAIVELLLDHGADVNAADENNRTPLGLVILTAAANGSPQFGFLQQWAIRKAFKISPQERREVARLLLDRGATIDNNPKDASMVYAASNFGDKNLVHLLITHGATLDDARTGETPLHAAIAEKHKDVAELLINSGANVNVRNKNSRTPLHFVASLLDDPDLAELLLKHGADVNARENKFGATPLAFAVRSRNVRVADVLRRHGGKE